MHEENGHKETRKPTLEELHKSAYKNAREGVFVFEDDYFFDDDDADCCID